jgi:predicted GTPase
LVVRDGFSDMARDVWDSVDEESVTMKHWQSKFRRLRQHLQGWTKNISGANKKEKKELLDTLDKLDKKAEGTILSPVEADL